MSRGRIVAYTVILSIAVIGFYLWRDFHLTGLDIKPPDVVIEDIELTRKVGDAKWTLSSPHIEHREGKIYGRSMDVTVEEDDGTVTKLFARSGVFTRETEDISLSSVSGDMERGAERMTLTAGSADYDGESKMWNLREGVVLSSDKITVKGPSGLYDSNSGVASVTGGGTATWQ